MKNIFITILLFGLILSACNPNKEIYEQLDKDEPPYRADIEYTLTESDYSAISSEALAFAETSIDSTNAATIGDKNAFSLNIPISNYAGGFLDGKFIAPKQGSTCLLSYNYLVNEFDSIPEYELNDDDYATIGGDVADSLAFSYDEEPEDYLPDFLFASDTTSNYIQFVTCEYIHEDFSRSDTSICFKYEEGEWTEANIYILTANDYDSMGAPGYYDNFSSGTEPEDYLPIYLEHKYPYAQSGKEVFIAYKYYNSGVSIKMTAYRFNGNNWSRYIEKSDPFVQNGENWLFDPTVHYSMIDEDFQIIADYIRNHSELSGYFDTEYENAEYYYGASAHYVNFDMRVSKRLDNDPLGFLTDLSEDETAEVIFGRLPEGLNIFLETKFPNSQAISNGVEVYYAIHYATYEPGDYYYVATFKCTGPGQFEYIETTPDE